MTAQFPALALILLFPALGFVFNVFFGRRVGRDTVNVIGPGVIFISFAIALWAFARLLAMAPDRWGPTSRCPRSTVRCRARSSICCGISAGHSA